MGRKLPFLCVVILVAMYGVKMGEAAGPAASSNNEEDSADSKIGNDGEGDATSPDADAAEAAPVGGPVPSGAFSNTEESGGEIDEFGEIKGSAITIHHSALFAAKLGLATILFSFF